jgi:hypothetical protein
MYTLFDMSYAILVLAHVFYWKREMLRKFYLTFLAMLVPFAYAFSMILSALYLFEIFKKKKITN